jgi:hypothetical protein
MDYPLPWSSRGEGKVHDMESRQSMAKFRALAKAYNVNLSEEGLSQACACYAKECEGLGDLETAGFWISLSGLLDNKEMRLKSMQSADGRRLLRKEEYSSASVSQTSEWWSSAWLSVLRTLEATGPVSMDLRPRGPLRAAVQELDVALFKAQREDWISIYPAQREFRFDPQARFKAITNALGRARAKS